MRPKPSDTYPGQHVPTAEPAPPVLDTLPDQLDKVDDVRTEFIDYYGDIRRPHQLAAEIVIDDEIEDAVNERLVEITGVLGAIDTSLARITRVMESPVAYGAKLCNPLDEELAENVLEIARQQILDLSREETFTEEVVSEKRRLFGKETVVSNVEKTRKTLGKGVILGLPKDTLIHFGSEFNYKYMSVPTYPNYRKKRSLSKAESLELESTRIQDAVVQLLTSTELDRHFDYREKRLPLLATRIVEQNIDIESLDIDGIKQLVPELIPVTERVNAMRNTIAIQDALDELESVNSMFFDVAPQEGMVSTIFYSEADIKRVIDLYKQARDIERLIFTDNDDYRIIWRSPEQVEQEMLSTIEVVFDSTVLSDAVLFHGTPALPRIIKSGHLLPAQKMSDEGHPFTFYTDRAGSFGSGIGIEGARGVHWAGNVNNAYIVNNGNLRLRDQLISEVEKRKGALAGGFVAIRAGDAVSHAPYIEDEDISAERMRKRHEESTLSRVIELTEDGFKKVRDKLPRSMDSDDTVFTAAPADQGNEAIFDYTFPIDELIIAVNAHEVDVVVEHLKEAGWSNKDIQDRLVIIPRASTVQVMEDLARDALDTHPKFGHRSIVIGLRREKLNHKKE